MIDQVPVFYVLKKVDKGEKPGLEGLRISFATF